MSNADPDGRGVSDTRLRMDLYELYHERASRERRWQFWRLAAGHLVVGVILAYAFVFDAWRFLALTPVLYGVVVMDALKYGVRLLYLERKLVELETRIQQREPLANWLTEFGVFGDGDRVELWDVDLNTIPETTQYTLIVSIYVVLVFAALLAWQPLDGPGGGPAITRGLLAVGYVTFTLLFAAILGVGYAHYRRVGDRIAELRAGGPAAEGGDSDAPEK